MEPVLARKPSEHTSAGPCRAKELPKFLLGQFPPAAADVALGVEKRQGIERIGADPLGSHHPAEEPADRSDVVVDGLRAASSTRSINEHLDGSSRIFSRFTAPARFKAVPFDRSAKCCTGDTDHGRGLRRRELVHARGNGNFASAWLTQAGQPPRRTPGVDVGQDPEFASGQHRPDASNSLADMHLRVALGTQVSGVVFQVLGEPAMPVLCKRVSETNTGKSSIGFEFPEHPLRSLLIPAQWHLLSVQRAVPLA